MRGPNRTSHEAVITACVSLAVWVLSLVLTFPLMHLDQATSTGIGTVGGIILLLVMPPLGGLLSIGALVLACISAARKEPHGPMALCFAIAGIAAAAVVIGFLVIL